MVLRKKCTPKNINGSLGLKIVEGNYFRYLKQKLVVSETLAFVCYNNYY